MTEAEYLACQDPAQMLASLTQGLEGLPADYCRRPSDRKLRLWVEACRERYDTHAGFPHHWTNLGDYPGQLTDSAATWASSRNTRHLPLADRAALLREVVGNPWKPQDALQFEWQQYRQAKQIARQIYESGDFESTGVLADALEEAGCSCEELLRHLRGFERCWDCFDSFEGARVYCETCNSRMWAPLRTPHVRGCFALDLVLGHS